MHTFRRGRQLLPVRKSNIKERNQVLCFPSLLIKRLWLKRLEVVMGDTHNQHGGGRNLLYGNTCPCKITAVLAAALSEQQRCHWGLMLFITNLKCFSEFLSGENRQHRNQILLLEVLTQTCFYFCVWSIMLEAEGGPGLRSGRSSSQKGCGQRRDWSECLPVCRLFPPQNKLIVFLL